jgi:hypothetical protein
MARNRLYGSEANLKSRACQLRPDEYLKWGVTGTGDTPGDSRRRRLRTGCRLEWEGTEERRSHEACNDALATAGPAGNIEQADCQSVDGDASEDFVSLLLLSLLLLSELPPVLLVSAVAVLSLPLRLSVIYQPEPLKTMPAGWKTRRKGDFWSHEQIFKGSSLKL